jgi:hypothetical protein
MKLRFVDGRVEVWDEEATLVAEYVELVDGVDVAEYAGGWVDPNGYQRGIIRDMLVSAIRHMDEQEKSENLVDTDSSAR